jgi:hypothetical protein
MIGVLADPAEQDVIREFFELFKTPWEFFHREGRYEVLLCAGDGPCDSMAKLVLWYAGRKTAFDEQQNIATGAQCKQSRLLSYQGNHIPIYGDSITFPEKGSRLLTDERSQECAAYLSPSQQRVVVRVGYDLFGEVRSLLTVGQPPANAHMPALELHIAFLRDLITGCGVSLAEIPPMPEWHPLIVCLTHDVDHPAFRQHRLDHTVLGFLYRAVFGSLLHRMRGRMATRDMLRNWAAALKLPFVQAGLAEDFWRGFADRYLELEKDLSSTFFVIPFKNDPGKLPDGPAPGFRASRYAAKDIGDIIEKLLAAGCEVGLHGIDAWLDSAKGREELAEIRRLTGTSEIGARMHWLYQDQQSPEVLEKAGAAYDATMGYNETVGYRAGTMQVYKPLRANRLLELPLHVMDTALFYPSYLGLSQQQAKPLVSQIVNNAARLGGCLTINWHDRSLAPERLWDTCYLEMVQDLKRRNAWFATAGQAVSWFRKRRAATFEMDGTEPGAVRANVAVDRGENLPGLRLRIHPARELRGTHAHGSADFLDLPVSETVDSGVRPKVTQ